MTLHQLRTCLMAVALGCALSSMSCDYLKDLFGGGSSRPGYLSVHSTPTGGELYLDGTPLGTTPTVVDSVSPGTHGLRVSKSGHHDWSQNVEVMPDETTYVNATLSAKYALEFIKTLDLDVAAKNLVVQGNHAYVAATSHLLIINIETPENPIEVGRLALGTALVSIGIKDDHVFLVDVYKGLIAVNVANPQSPAKACELRFGSRNRRSVVVDGDYAYCASDDGFHVVDISAPSNCRIVGGVPDLWYFGDDLIKEDGYVYAAGVDASGYARLRAIDVTSPSSPAVTSVQGLGSIANALSSGDVLAAQGGRLYVSEQYLYEFDLASPGRPMKVDSLVDPWYSSGHGVAATDTLLYFAASATSSTHELHVVLHNRVLCSANTPSAGLGIATTDRCIYVADLSGNLEVLRYVTE